jgi:catechol 2,3-dioxygenase-like lactoylglutathione lyase family enzyme
MKVHLSLPTSKLDASVAFYRTLLDAEPFKRRADYALFVVDAPGIELALDVVGHAASGSSALSASNASAGHFGIAVDDERAVESAIERLEAAGLPVDVERGMTCCYAKQTKVWAVDPDGRRWEVYYVHAETELRDGGERDCCTEPECPTYAECCA